MHFTMRIVGALALSSAVQIAQLPAIPKEPVRSLSGRNQTTIRNTIKDSQVIDYTVRATQDQRLTVSFEPDAAAYFNPLPPARSTALAGVAAMSAALSLAAAQQASAVPPPPAQRTAVCDRPVYATDQLVCEDEQLRAAADRSGLPDGGRLLESASDWFRRRSLCAFEPSHRSCALAAYHERLAVVQTLAVARGRPLPLNVTCGNAVWRGDRRSVPDGDTLLLEQEGQPIAVAVAEARDDPLWRAFLRADITGWRLTLTPLTGAPLICSMSTALEGVSDDGLRQRVETVDALFARARAGAAAGTIDRSAYAAVLSWLRDEELLVHAEAELRTFSDPTTYNYWHRARLKFPTQTQQEIERLNNPAAR